MTDTAQTSATSQFCGSCGAAVRSYWNSCASCAAPLEVTPVGEYADEPVAAPAPTSRPTLAYTPPPDVAPQMGGYPPPSDIAPPSTPPPPPPGYGPEGGNASPSGWAPQEGYAPPPPAGYVPQPAGYVPQPQAGYAPPPPAGYVPQPQPGYGATAQFPSANVQPSYQGNEPSRRSSTRSGPPWLVIVIALVVLLLGAGGYAGYNATKLSSSNSHLSDTKALLATTSSQLATAKAELDQAQSQLTDSKVTINNQAAEIGAYKQCISDLSTADAATSQSQFNADEIQSAKDCLSLGLS